MTRKVERFPVPFNPRTAVRMRKGAEIVGARGLMIQHPITHEMGMIPMLWAVVDESRPKVWRHFAFVGADQEVPRGAGQVVGQMPTPDQSSILIVFDLGEIGEPESDVARAEETEGEAPTSVSPNGAGS